MLHFAIVSNTFLAWATLPIEIRYRGDSGIRLWHAHNANAGKLDTNNNPIMIYIYIWKYIKKTIMGGWILKLTLFDEMIDRLIYVCM